MRFDERPSYAEGPTTISVVDSGELFRTVASPRNACPRPRDPSPCPFVSPTSRRR
jgi:hypothetical protein